MTGCSLVASGLVSNAGGQVPTFNHALANPTSSANYYGIQVTYMSGTSTCYDGFPPFTPILKNDAQQFTRTCEFIVQGSDYTAILCPDAHPTAFLDSGVLTISFAEAQKRGVPAPAPVTASYGAVAGWETPTLTATSTATATTTPTPTSKAGKPHGQFFASAFVVLKLGETDTPFIFVFVKPPRVFVVVEPPCVFYTHQHSYKLAPILVVLEAHQHAQQLAPIFVNSHVFVKLG
ncbi:hypothetical protein IQ07DRAFT_642669 [Pyrenochaeta sp. DS3sAY3a]|nr:hypothetical protein IQ07DRAFT_642669 [Pyrenochaeta sp. DS3sAY3a]